MEKNALIWTIVACIVLVLAAGLGSVYFLTQNTDDFGNAEVLKSDSEKALEASLKALQDEKAKLAAELAKAQEVKKVEPKVEPKVEVPEEPKVDSLGLYLDLSNCDSLIDNLKDQEKDLRRDVEDALEDYDDELQQLVTVKKTLVVIEANIANSTGTVKEDFQSQKKDEEDNEDDEDKDVDKEKDNFEDKLSDWNSVTGQLVSVQNKCLDSVQKEYDLKSKATCDPAVRKIKNLYNDAEDDRDDAKSDYDNVRDDFDKIGIRISDVNNLKTAATNDLVKKQYDEEISLLKKLERSWKDWKEDFEDWKNDLDDLENDADKKKDDIEKICKRF